MLLYCCSWLSIVSMRFFHLVNIVFLKNNFYSFTTFKQIVLHCCGTFLPRSVQGSLRHPPVMAFRFSQVWFLWLRSPCVCVLVQGWVVCVQLGGTLWICVYGVRSLRSDCFRSVCTTRCAPGFPLFHILLIFDTVSSCLPFW